jgi:hypothetical protein
MTPAERKIVEELIRVTYLVARQQRKPRHRDMLIRAAAVAQAVLDGAVLDGVMPAAEASYEAPKIKRPAADPLEQLRAALAACDAAGLPGGVVAAEAYRGFRLDTLTEQEPVR